MAELILKEISYAIQGAAYEVYKALGSGQKEKIYHNAFRIALQQKGLEVESEKRIAMYFQGQNVGMYTPDIVVNNEILIELKAKPFLTKEDLKQFWQYLKSTSFRVGYLINFGNPKGVHIVRRVYDTARKKH